MIIKIFSTIYLSLRVLVPSVTFYWHHESWVHKTRKFVQDTRKTGSTSNCHLLMTIRLLRKILTLYSSLRLLQRCYTHRLVRRKKNLIHQDIIFVAKKNYFSKQNISPNMRCLNN